MPELTRRKLVQLAQGKRADARLLLQRRRWATAYYLYGLSVELAIKAVIAKGILAQTIPDKNFSATFYSHELSKLITLSGLGSALQAQLGYAEFKASWEIVSGWRVESRYENVDQGRALAISEAVDGRNAGVFRWLKTHW